MLRLARERLIYLFQLRQMSAGISPASFVRRLGKEGLSKEHFYQEHLPVFGSGFCRGSQHLGFFPAASCANTIQH